MSFAYFSIGDTCFSPMENASSVLLCKVCETFFLAFFSYAINTFFVLHLSSLVVVQIWFFCFAV